MRLSRALVLAVVGACALSTAHATDHSVTPPPAFKEASILLTWPGLPVLVVNLPLDDDGNLRVVEQSTAPRAVEVVNLPAVQNVAGTVNVGNLPATQTVTGQISVANLPLDGSGNLRVTATGPRVFRFIGVTVQQFQGTGTLAAMTAACYREYPGSRMAFTDEYALSINPGIITDTGWIQPRIAVAAVTNDRTVALDAAGNVIGVRYDSVTQNCEGWVSGGTGYGSTLTPVGAIGQDACSSSHGVACAAPE